MSALSCAVTELRLRGVHHLRAFRLGSAESELLPRRLRPLSVHRSSECTPASCFNRRQRGAPEANFATALRLFSKSKSSPRKPPASNLQYSVEAAGEGNEMADRQRAVHISSFEGGPRGWKEFTKLLTDKPIPKAGPGEVVVRMKVRPVNPSDGLSLMGLYGGFRNPGTPGLEGMGEVSEIGDGVDGLKIGQRVAPLLGKTAGKGEGSWQEYVKVQSALVIPVPDKVSDESAAQLVVNPFTAYGMLKDLSPPEGEYLLQTAANSTIGRQFIQLAHHWGIKTINVVRRSTHVEELKALGADEVISSEEEDVVKRVEEITGRKMAFAATDCVAGDTTKLVASLVRPGGKILVYGGASSPDVHVAIKDLLFRGLTVQGFWLSLYMRQKSDAEIHALGVEIMGFMERGVLEPYSGERFNLENFAEAVKKQVTPGRPGKLLLVG